MRACTRRVRVVEGRPLNSRTAIEMRMDSAPTMVRACRKLTAGDHDQQPPHAAPLLRVVKTSMHGRAWGKQSTHQNRRIAYQDPVVVFHITRNIRDHPAVLGQFGAYAVPRRSGAGGIVRP